MKTEHNNRLQRTTTLSRFLRTPFVPHCVIKNRANPFGDAVAAERGGGCTHPLVRLLAPLASAEQAVKVCKNVHQRDCAIGVGLNP
jgi:hypothetical protein